MTTVTLQDVFTAAQTLSREDRIRLREMITEATALEARRAFRPGDKVKFTTKQGATIVGTVQRVNAKSIKVTSEQDRYGSKLGGFVTWTVSPILLQAA